MFHELGLGPQKIKEIRELLGLSQAEAGNLIGGGPKAFSKYESGAIKPSASVENILKILEANPDSLKTLKGIRIAPFEHLASKPLEVSGDHVSVLSPHSFTLLIRRLLSAEASANDLPMDGIHVAAKITIADDGEDARIEWKDGPMNTKFLSNRLNQFQLKAGPISPALAGKDVLKTNGTVKAEVADALKNGGTYTMLCARSYNRKEIRKRIDSIRVSLRNAGIAFDDKQISFRDADQIAEWINKLPAVSSWLLERTRPGMIGPFRPWSYWAESPEHNIQLVEDKRLVKVREVIRSRVSEKRSITRVFGFSGVGKSRLILESFSPTKMEDVSGIQLSELVLYADEQITGTNQLKSVIQSLSDSGYRAIIIIDRCTTETQQDLAALVKRTSSELSLVTINDEIPQGEIDNSIIIIPEAHVSVIVEMIKNIFPQGPFEDHQRLVKLSLGFPRMAVLIGQSWLEGKALVIAPKDLFEQVVSGGKQRQPTYMSAAKILATFGAIGAKFPADTELDEIAKFSRNLSVDDLRAEIEELAIRGIVQRKGRMIVIQPRPVALRLAEQQWHEWGQERWDDILAGSLNAGLRGRAARQLALLNTTPIAVEVTKSLCRNSGPLDSIEKIYNNGYSKILPTLSEIDAEAVLSLLERLMNGLSEIELNNIIGDCRRNFVKALERISFLPKTFERGAKLLLSLAVAENEHWDNNATGQFKSLFPAILGNTSADGKIRLRFIDHELQYSKDKRRFIIANALLDGCKGSHIRMLGSESHGSRPSLEPWHPNRNEELEYIYNCADRLITLAKENTSAGKSAKIGLGQQLRTFLSQNGNIDFIEKTVSQIMDNCDTYWNDALESLSNVIIYDKESITQDILSRIKTLIHKLQPSSLTDRVKYLVTDMPWNFPCDKYLDFETQNKYQREAIENIVKEILEIPNSIESQLKYLSSGKHNMSLVFGNALAKFSQDNEQWYPIFIKNLQDTNSDLRNFDLFSGYLAGLSALGKNKCIDNFKKMAIKSDIFAPALPSVCYQMGILDTDIPLICNTLKSGLLEPDRLLQWTFGGILSKLSSKVVIPLLDTLFTMNNIAYTIALELFGMYVHGQPEKIDSLMPQAFTAVSKIPIGGIKNSGSQMREYHFNQIMSWILKKGKDNNDAKNLALLLSKKLIENYDDPIVDLIQPLIPELLGNFSESIWPLLGNAIASDQKIRWKFEHILKNKFSISEKETSNLLKLPENTLFAWCHAYPDIAPSFVATIIPILAVQNEENSFQVIHPVFKRLLDEFGDRKDVLDSINRNINTFGWLGSITNYYALYELPIKNLENHAISQVREWAQHTLEQLDLAKKNAHDRDEENQAIWGV